MAKTEEKQQDDAVIEALSGILNDGDQLHVICRDGNIQVTRGKTGCEKDHPRLYGFLLSLNEEIDKAGTTLFNLAVVGAVVFCLGLHLDWWTSWLGDGIVGHLQSIWFYLAFVIGTFFLAGGMGNWFEKRRYQHRREELATLLAEGRLDRYELLALIQNDNALTKVASQIKMDRLA